MKNTTPKKPPFGYTFIYFISALKKIDLTEIFHGLFKAGHPSLFWEKKNKPWKNFEIIGDDSKKKKNPSFLETKRTTIF